MKTLGQIALEAAVPGVDWNNVHKENQDYYERIAKAVAEETMHRFFSRWENAVLFGIRHNADYERE